MQRPIYTIFDIKACILALSSITENYPYWITWYGTFHIDEIWVLEHMESSIHTKFVVCVCILTLNAIFKKNYPSVFTGSVIFHILVDGQIGQMHKFYDSGTY